MNKEFTYSAFISYSHKDQKYAQNLQKKLESYRLPSALQHQIANKSKHPVAPVFRDATDLVAGKLNENLRRELEQSKFLIVICSPNSAQKNEQGKHYVNSEVDHFVSLGRADYIIPVIIDGIPGDPEKECFCPTIKSLELVGVDATKFSDTRVINDIAAKILGLRPDELWQREKRRILRKKILCSIGIIFCILLGCACGIYCWDYNRDYIEHYAGCVKKWNIPCGITPLSEDELKFRYRHLRFLYRGRTGLFGKRILREVTLRNSSGEIAEDKRGDVYQDFLVSYIPRTVLIYHENGVLSHCEYYNKEGKNTYTESYSGPDLRFCDLKMVKKGQEYLELPDLNQKTEKSFIVRFDVVRDSYGRIKKCIFRSGDNMEAIKGPDGDYGYTVEYNENSRIVTYNSLDFNGNPMYNNKKGYVCRYEYDKLGQLKRIRYTDVKGNLINSTAGYACAELDYDSYGNYTSICYFDANGNKTNYNDRFAKVTFSYKNGNIHEIRHQDKNDVPCTVQKNKIPACVKLQHDEWGNLTKVSYLDANGKSVYYDSESCAEKTMKYIRKAGRFFVISEEKTGINGKLVHLPDAPSKYEYEYDENGNRTVERRYGSDSKLYRKKGAYAVIQKKYDVKNRVVYKAYFDADLRRMADENGLAFYKIIYETNKTTLLYYGPDEQFVIPKNEGCAKYVKYYDEFKRFIRGECYDQNEAKMNRLTENWHAVVVEYAPNNQIARMSFYDKDNNKCLARLNEHKLFSELRLKYDNNNIVEEAYYGVDENLFTQKQGYAVIQRRFNNNQLVEESLLDRNLALCKPYNGMNAKTTYEYHVNGKRKSVTYHSNDGRYERHQYDINGYLIQTSYHAPNGELFLGYEGVARIEYKNNEQGKEVERAFYNSYGKRVLNHTQNIAGIRFSYDLKGNRISESYFNLQEKNCRSATRQVAKIHYQYNSASKVIAEHYYDEQDRRMEDSEQIAGVKYTYNKSGKILSIKFFGVNEMIKNNIYGIHEIAYQYNARNCKTEELYRNTAGKLVLGPLKIAGWRFEYDEKDRIIKKMYIGLNGKITKGPEGHAVEENEYDLMGNKTLVCCYDENLKKCNNNAGVCIAKVKYDNMGRMIESHFFDKDGQVANFEFNGFHSDALFISYDRFANKKYLYKLSPGSVNNKNIVYYYSYQTDNGLVLESGWLDQNKKAADNEWGFAVKKYKYDLSGNLLEEKTFNAADNPCVDKRTGVSTTKYDYRYQNDGSCTIEGNFLNPKGFPVERDGSAWGQFKYDKDHNLIYFEIRDKNGEFPLSNLVKWYIAYDSQRRPIRLQQYGCIMQNGKKVLQKNNDVFFAINDEKGVVICMQNGKQSTGSIAQYNQIHQNFMLIMDTITNIFKPIKKDTEIKRIEAKKIIGYTMIVASNIIPKSSAEKCGIQPGDFVLNYAGVDWTQGKVQMASDIQRVRNVEKRLVFARKNPDGSFYVFAKIFPAGVMGIGLNEIRVDILDYKNIIDAYKEFQKKK